MSNFDHSRDLFDVSRSKSSNKTPKSSKNTKMVSQNIHSIMINDQSADEKIPSNHYIDELFADNDLLQQHEHRDLSIDEFTHSRQPQSRIDDSSISHHPTNPHHSTHFGQPAATTNRETRDEQTSFSNPHPAPEQLENALSKIIEQDRLIGQLQQENNQLKQQNEGLGQDHQQRHQQLQELQQQNQHMQIKNQELQEDNQQLQQSSDQVVDNLHLEVTRLQQRETDLMSKVRDLEKSHQKMLANEETNEGSHNQLVNEYNKLQEIHQQLKREFEHKSSKLQNVVDELGQAVDDKHNECQQIEREYEELAEKYDGFSKQHQNDLQQLKDDNSYLAEQHIELRRAYEELQSAFKSLKSQSSENNNVLSGTKDDNAKLRNELRSTKNFAEKQEKETEDLRRCIVSLEAKNKELTDTINQHFYNKASDYKDRVLGLLQKSEDPKRMLKIMNAGIEPSSIRLNNILNQERVTTHTYATTTHKHCHHHIPTDSEVIRSHYRNRSISPNIVIQEHSTDSLTPQREHLYTPVPKRSTAEATKTPERSGQPINPYKVTESMPTYESGQK